MAITAGTYLVGANGDYADLNAALLDLEAGATMTGDVTFVNVSGYSNDAIGALYTIDLAGYTLKITSAIQSRGKGTPQFLVEMTNTAGGSCQIECSNTVRSKIIIEHQYWKKTVAPTTGVQPMLYVRSSSTGKTDVEMHDCIFDMNDQAHAEGPEFHDELIVSKVWNCAFLNTVESGAKGLDVTGNATTAEWAYIDNCIAVGCDIGFYTPSAVVFTNNLAFDCTTEAFRPDVPGLAAALAASDGNVSDDSSYDHFGGSFNRQIELVADDIISTNPTNKDFMVPYDDSELYVAGVAPSIGLNTTSVEGSARPGSHRTFAVGMVERREVLRQHWNTAKKVTINGSKITVSDFSMQIAITDNTPGMDDVLEVSRDDGGDVRVTLDRFGYDEVPVEVAQWDRETGHCIVWVKVAVVAGQDLDLYVWTGNPNAAQVPQDHIYGQFNVWTGFTFVMHCMEDPIADGWVKDSSPAKHYGVWNSPQSDTWQGGIPSGFGRSYKFVSGTYIKLPSGDYLNNSYGAMYHAWIDRITTNGVPVMDISENASTNYRWRVFAATSNMQVSWRMPDGSGGTFQNSTNDPGTLNRQWGASLKTSATKHIRQFFDGALDQNQTPSQSVRFTNSDSTTARIGDFTTGGGTPNTQMNEVWLYKGTDKDEAGIFAAWYENMRYPWVFFKTPTYVNQDGARSFRFATESGEVTLQATDFYIEYAKNTNGDVGFTLTAVWEAVGLDQDWGLKRRLAIESRLRELATFLEKRGTLHLDFVYPAPYEQTFRDVYLTLVESRVVDNNTAIEYSLGFNKSLQGSVALVARTLRFSGVDIVAQNFFVEYGADDRTSFKNVWRAAPIRIENGPSLKTLRIVGMIAVAGGGQTEQEARRKVEEYVKRWSNELLGTEGTLLIDGVSEGTCHLASVSPSDLSLPDRVGIDLEFVTGYGS